LADIDGGYGVFGREEDEALNDVAKFADVAGPGVAAKFCDGVGSEKFLFPVVLSGDLASKMGDEIGKIFGAFAQRRERKRKNVNTMEEIAAEGVLLDEIFEIAVRGDEDANVDANGLVAADAFDFTFFEDAQQFGLHGDGHIADFVEEERAAFGLFEFAEMLGGGAGERALFVAEKFGFDEFGGDGGAIQSDEGIFAARGFFVNSARDEFLAGAGFAEDTDAGFAGGDAIDLGEKFFHRGPTADELVFAEAVAELAVFVFEAGEAEGIFYGDEELVGGERLFEKIESAEFGGFDGHFDVGLAGDENDGRFDAGVFQVFEKLDAAFAGHDDVGKNQVKGFGAEKFEGAGRVVANGGFMASEAKGARKRGQRIGVVIDEEEVSFARQWMSFVAGI